MIIPNQTPSKAPARRKKKPKPLTTTIQPVLRPHAAGIDVGATAMYVAVPSDADPCPVRTFGTFTEDLHALADWLVRCQIRTVALESTGVYWIPLFQILEARGLEVCLVNARHVKHVPGRKTDVQDCQWLQYLHSVGLLRASFRPPAHVCAVRSLWRQRRGGGVRDKWRPESGRADMLVRYASGHVQHMQKALTQMNIQLANVISDLTGRTGLAIIDGILGGERDGAKLATLRDGRIKADEATIAKSLAGDWKEEHLFCLEQARLTYAHYQLQIQACEEKIAVLLQTWESAPAGPAAATDGTSTTATAATTAQPTPPPHAGFDLREELTRLFGVDLTSVPGLQTTVAGIVLSEVGTSVERFPTVKHFSSWPGLCPDNRKTGGKTIKVATREVKSRLAYGLRLAANALHRSQSALGDYFRRMKAKLGGPEAITAMAHKLARIIYHLLKYRCPYDQGVFAKEEAHQRQRREHRLRAHAAQLGFQLTPLQTM
jgi:transposase